MEKSVIDTIKLRKSIRTYEQKTINDEHLSLLQQYINKEENLVGPIGGKAKFEIIEVSNNISNKGIKLGTYGFIKNHQGYIVGISENSKTALLQFGYIFEKLILYATQLGLGTCWMGGTFNRTSFKKELELNNDEFIPCISSIGYPKEKQRIFDKTLRYVTKADNKKAWEELFFNENFNQSLSKADAGQLAIPIEMIRLGPSASNKQPWRIILSKDKKRIHFYLSHTSNYSGNKLGFDMQVIDIGIAMCHFELACIEQQLKGQWVFSDPNLKPKDDHTEYMITWQMA